MRAIKRTVLGILVAMLFPVIAMAGYAGIYGGNFKGAYSGAWLMRVSSGGTVKMIAYTMTDDTMGVGYGYLMPNGYIEILDTAKTSEIRATIYQDGYVSGSWVADGLSGEMYGFKQEAPGTAVGLYSGTIYNLDGGPRNWTMNVFPSGDVVGSVDVPWGQTFYFDGMASDGGLIFLVDDFTGQGFGYIGISEDGRTVEGWLHGPDGRYVTSFTGTKHTGLSKTEISQLYVAIFNRASEGGGNQFWRQQGDVVTVANAMLETQAAKDYFGTSLDTDQAFIEHIYLNTLNKTISEDPGGIAYWVGLLSSGLSRGEVVATLVGVIGEYGPNGLYYDPSSPLTIAAYNQFMNRVEVSNYMADKVGNPPHNWQVSTSFSHGLSVTDNPASVSLAKQVIDSMR